MTVLYQFDNIRFDCSHLNTGVHMKISSFHVQCRSTLNTYDMTQEKCAAITFKIYIIIVQFKL